MPSLFRRRTEAGARAERVRLDERRDDGPPRALGRRVVLFGLLFIAVFLLILELIFPVSISVGGSNLSDGQVAREEIVAPFDFDVLKSDQELKEERDMAAAQVLPVFKLDNRQQTELRKRFGEFLTRVYDIRSGSGSERQKLDMLGQLGVALSDTTRRVLLDPSRSGPVEERARQILLGLAERGVVRTRGAPDLSGDDTIMYEHDDSEAMVRYGQFLKQEEVPEAVAEEARRGMANRAAVKAVVEIVRPFVSENVLYQPDETERRREEARQSVSVVTGMDVKKDEVIVERGQRITKDDLRVIRSMERKRNELLKIETGPRRFLPRAGRILVALVLLGALVLYLAVRRPTLLTDTRCQALFLVLVMIVMGAAAALGRVPEASVHLVPIALIAMFASLLFDFEFGVASMVFTTILAAVYTGFGLPFIFISVVAGVVAAHSVRRVRDREDFYWSAIRVVAAYAAAIAVNDLSRAEFGFATLTHAGWGGLNAVVSMGVVVVALPLFERGFRVTTDITLLELADMNKPLLRKMAMTAPGTYHHSIIVGNLAEAAAEAIHANGLLARVGSYYHDIGKLVTPGYFVENQQGLEPSESKHTGIRPKVSSLVIRSHVRDGVELARKEALPEPLIDIIREHHGTSVMEYFYNKALEEAEDPSEVSADDFSYPGPRARSKESAIIALADTLEARVRSIGEPLTQKRIEAEVDEVIEKRWAAHQLDDAELTLSDLRKIREAFSRVLVGMYHQRIKYPDQEEEGGKAADGPPSGTPSGPGDGR
jgi:putative nucleotidyltransferase with HDIG domain